MPTSLQHWRVLDAERPVLTCEYSFGPASATAFAARGAAGLVVVSPPRRIPNEAYDELASYGPVSALVAPNAFHHLGLPEWKRRFPDAAVFAPLQSIERVAKRSGIEGIRPVSDAASLTGADLELVDMPYYRTGEALVRMRTGHGSFWYVTDVIMNMPRLPQHPIAKVLFGATRSAPGLRFNNIAPLFMVKDRRALRQWLAHEFARDPPRWLVPAHGEVVEFTDPNLARRLFAGYS